MRTLSRQLIGIVAAASFMWSGVALADEDDDTVLSYGELMPVTGVARANISLDRTGLLMANAYAWGGKPAGTGTIDRTGMDVVITVNGQPCAGNRDVRRDVVVSGFKGGFNVTAACVKRLPAGDHEVVATRTNINAEKGKMRLSWSVLRGLTDKE